MGWIQALQWGPEFRTWSWLGPNFPLLTGPEVKIPYCKACQGLSIEIYPKEKEKLYCSQWTINYWLLIWRQRSKMCYKTKEIGPWRWGSRGRISECYYWEWRWAAVLVWTVIGPHPYSQLLIPSPSLSWVQSQTTWIRANETFWKLCFRLFSCHSRRDDDHHDHHHNHDHDHDHPDVKSGWRSLKAVPSEG